MASFDMVSLFIDSPLKECIDLAVSYIPDRCINLKLSKADLTKLFSIVTSETRVFFIGKMYDQIDGVAMGSPLAPVLANIFLVHHEIL